MGRRIIAILMLVLTVALATVPSFAADAVALTPLDMSTIEEDFAGANFDTQKFIDNLEDPTKPEICIAREYVQYRKVSGNLIWLYLYVYVPYGIEGGINTVPDMAQFQIGKNINEVGIPESYKQIECEPIDSTDCGRFYKFKLDVTTLRETFQTKRIYVIGLASYYCNGEFLIHGNYFKDLRRFLFTGSDLNDDLLVESSFDTVIDLDTVLQRYRTESGSFDGFRNDIFYVYFSVPNSYLKKYESLSGVEYKYFEEFFNVFLCSDEEVFNYANQLMAYGEFPDVYDEEKNMPTIETHFAQAISIPLEDYRLVTYYLNSPYLDDYPIRGEYEGYHGSIPELKNVLLVDDWTADGVLFENEDVKNRFDFIPSYKTTQYGWNNKITTPEEIVSVDTMFGGEDRFTKWWANYILGYSDEVVNDMDVSNPCIEKIDDDFFINFSASDSWCKLHMIEETDMDDVRKFYDEAVAADRTMYIMRFPEPRMYYAYKSVLSVKGGYNSFLLNENGIYAHGSIITNFNIISFRFNNNGISYKVLVNDEIQNFPLDGEGGQDDDGDNLEEAVKQGLSGIGDYLKGLGDKTSDLVEQLKEILKVVAIVIGCILLLILASFVLPLIVSLIGALFRAIGGAFERLFKRKGKDKDNDRKDE